MKILRLIDALRLMERTDKAGKKKIVFGIKGVKYNRKAKTGGSEYSYEAASLPYEVEPAKKSSGASAPARATKNPNHFENATRNLKVAGQRELVKINIWLITHMTIDGEPFQIVH